MPSIAINKQNTKYISTKTIERRFWQRKLQNDERV